MAPKKAVEKETLEDGSRYDPETGVVDEKDAVTIENDAEMFGGAEMAGSAGGLTIKQIKIPKQASVFGIFRGFLPFEYEDKKDTTRGKVALNWVIIDVLHPKTKKPVGITGKIMGTVRIINDIAVAEPGDMVRIVRMDQIELGRNRMWDDTVTIWPAEGRKASIALARGPVSTLGELKTWNDGVRKQLPSAPVPKESSDTVDTSHILSQQNKDEAGATA